MLTAIFTFIGTPIGKIVSTIILLGFLFISVLGAIKIHDSRIRREALNEFNKKQLELTVKSQQEFLERSKRLEELGQTTIDELKKQREELDRRLSDIDVYLSSPEVKKNDKEVGQILKETIRRLGGQK